MGSPMTLSLLAVSDPERSKSRSLGFQSLISRNLVKKPRKALCYC